MRHRAIIRPEAENDLNEAFSWYEDKRQGLGHDFLLQVDAGLRILVSTNILWYAWHKYILLLCTVGK